MKKINIFAIVCALFLFFLAWSAYFFSRPISIANEIPEPPRISEPNLYSLSWMEVTSSAPWITRDAPGAIVFHDKMFLMGGINGNPVADNTYVEYWRAPHFNDIWSTEDGLNWTREAATSTWAPRRSLSLAEFNGKLWMLGGWGPATGYNTSVFASEDGVHWSVATTSPRWSDREGQVVRVFQNKLWLFGGVNFDEHKTFNDIWASEDGVNWTEVASSSPWSPRYDHDVIAYKGKLWLMGGLHLGGAGESDAWVSENGKDWTFAMDTAPWGPRHGHTLLVYKGYMWVIGGWDLVADRGAQTIWYSADGYIWQKTSQDAPWIGREDHAAFLFNDAIWIAGGMNTGFKWSNDVWRSKFDE